MKKILVPTDFTVDSLIVLKQALADNQNEKLDIILVHGYELSNSISDLLFFNKHAVISSLENKAFREAKDIIRNKFESQINSIQSDIFSGYNNKAFKNYLESHNIEEAFVPVNYKLKKVHKRSFDIVPFVKNSTPKVVQVETQDTSVEYAVDTVARIFA